MAELLKLDAPRYIVVHFVPTSGDATPVARIAADTVYENDNRLELGKDGKIIGSFFLSRIAGWWADV